MKKIYLTLLITAFATVLQAQEKAKYISMFTGVGTENNIGNPAFFLGLGAEKMIGKRVVAGVSLTRFTTGGRGSSEPPQFAGREQDFYRSWFLTPKIGYSIIGQSNAFFRTTLYAGPALQLYNYNTFSSGRFTSSNGELVPVPGTVQYEKDKGLRPALYAGIDFSFRVADNCRLSLQIDSYSHEIPFEFTLAGIKANIAF